MDFTITSIPKAKGKVRTIYVPSPSLKTEQRRLLPELMRQERKMAKHAHTSHVAHGFIAQRSPVTNAQAHAGFRYTLSVDLQDWFDTCKPPEKTLSNEIREKCLVDGVPRQGFPTSPAIANICAIGLDVAITRYLKRKANHHVVYTRYADDLTFSSNFLGELQNLKNALPQIVGQSGFKIAKHKTRMQSHDAGRRIITGVAVDRDGVYPTRAVKRKLRAALHRNNEKSIHGLEEWCKLRTPRGSRQSLFPSDTVTRDAKGKLAEVKRFLSERRVRKLSAADEQIVLEKASIPDEKIGDVIITADPIYILGCSTFTNGWTSCLSWPSGKYKRSTLSWLMLPGTRVAYIPGTGNKTFSGVTRRVMAARALIHKMRDGSVWHDRVYGNAFSMIPVLEKAGIKHVGRAKNLKVVGNIPTKRGKPYCDTLHVKKARHRGQDVYVFYS